MSTEQNATLLRNEIQPPSSAWASKDLCKVFRAVEGGVRVGWGPTPNLTTTLTCDHYN